MRVLVTGALGFIGSHVVDELHAHAHAVAVLDNLSTGKIENLSEETLDMSFFQHCDVLNEKKVLESCFKQFYPDVVIHLAAQAAISTSWDNPQFDLDVNSKGTLNVLQAAFRYGVKRFVFSSTSAVYSDKWTLIHPMTELYQLGPSSPYGISKLAAEYYVRTMFPESVILRFGNVYGPRQVPLGENQLLSRMIRHFNYGDKFYIHGSGRQKRDFVYVTDVARAVVASLEGEPGTYNVATGESHSVNEVASLVENYYKVPGYKWDHTAEEDPRENVCQAIGAAEHGLGWKPKVSLEDGVRATIEWWQEHGKK